MTAIAQLPDVLIAVAPHLSAADIETWTHALTAPMQSSGIVTEKRIAMFIGQACEESGAFTELVEDLSYSVLRLCEVWPSRFSTSASAAPFARNPQRLANHVYANRMGNGDEASGDGWMFRGRGLFQITGRSAYSIFAASLHQPLADVVAWMETPDGAAQSACWWWSNQGHAFMGLCDDWDVRGVTQRTNGGMTGLGARVMACGTALAVLAGGRPVAVAQTHFTPPAPDPSADDLNAEQLTKLGA
jgi:putative chitinase